MIRRVSTIGYTLGGGYYLHFPLSRHSRSFYVIWRAYSWVVTVPQDF
jgi:hypothetical protein